MAPMRRRASRRVVKSTFQECFEYDIPGFRSVEVKRPSLSLTRNRVSNNLNNKTKPKQESSSKLSRDSSSKNERLTEKKAKNADEKVKDEIKKNIVESKHSERVSKLQSSLSNRRNIKSTFMGSDYKRFKAPLSSNKMKSKVAVNKKLLPTKITSETKSTVVPDPVFESNSWQPVVHLKKLSIDKTELSKSFKTPNQNKVKTQRPHRTKQSLESQDLATRLKNALKDPMAEKEDLNLDLSDGNISNTKLVEETIEEKPTVKTRNAVSRKTRQEPEDKVVAGKNSSVDKLFEDDRVSSKHAGSDSALEDWPESSSETTDDPLFKVFAVDEVTMSSATDWASPHVTQFLHWQKQFSNVTNDLKSSFDSLKSIIEEKNSLISALKNKLDCYNENTCHKILERILLDYDKHDSKNPATVIVNSILDYPNSNC